jgi:hypothetical protein
MTTPHISGKYQFQVDLNGLRLPVTFTVPDISDTPLSDFDPSPSMINDETSQTNAECTHTDSLDAIHLEEDQPNPLLVSPYPFIGSHRMYYRTANKSRAWISALTTRGSKGPITSGSLYTGSTCP